jgi:hypothetical protein
MSINLKKGIAQVGVDIVFREIKKLFHKERAKYIQ